MRLAENIWRLTDVGLALMGRRFERGTWKITATYTVMVREPGARLTEPASMRCVRLRYGVGPVEHFE